MSAMSLNSLIVLASEANGEPAIHPYVIGGIALAILLALLAIVMIFGGGRDHS